ncbi:acetylxylan esterase [Burkholderia stabilis]|uniref:acetylxylan esterase n=1 Tax=Burkholderia stabilis TaxID=95485 RepID=UPI00114694A3|nr:acetylxylan esterase [Burkholderia stabilis]
MNEHTHKSPAPLAGDPARQAVDSLRGYDYQIWRSVEAWMHLADGQALFLEGAEDFDIVSDSAAESTQVKITASNITLGSADVRKAIENCWLLIERNVGRASVTMRFLTRGGIGLEQGNPFGKEPGIKLWQRAASGSDEAADRIALYLKGVFKDAQLNQFLSTANADALRERLFQRLAWVTEEPSFEATVITVERLAIQVGRSRDVGALDSLRALDGLLAHCRATATKETLELRSLTLEDMIRIFEEKTDIRIPGTRAMFTKLASSLMSTLTAPTSGGAITFTPATFGVEPSLPAFVLPRSPLVKAITESKRPVLIVGTEGRGKTTVASLAGQQLGDVDWWVDLSATETASLPDVLERLLTELRYAKMARVVVIDDLPVTEGLAQDVWARVSAIFDECGNGNHRLICTAKGVHPEAVDPKLRAAQVAIHSIPDLSLPEVKDFVGRLGCPEDLSDLWSERILAESGGGHPKLVHLRGLELQDAAWPTPTAELPSSPPRSIQEARNFARRQATRSLTNEERELLYAMSLALHPIDRSTILSIGSEFANLDMPGDTLDRLVGRWIESVGVQGYRTTALLAGQAESVWPKSKVRGAHASLFDALSGQGTISVDQAFPIFLHGWHSGDDDRAAGYLACLVNEQSEMRSIVYEHLAPIMSIGRSGSVIPDNIRPRTLAILRLIQFRVAQQEKTAELPLIAKEWQSTIKLLPEGRMRDGACLIRAFLITGKREASLSTHTVIEALVDLHRHQHLFQPDAQDDISPDLFPDGIATPQNLVPTTFGFIFGQLDSLDALSELLDAMEATNAGARQQMLRAFNIPFFRKSHLFVDGPFVAESRRQPPRWEYATSILLRMINMADQWKCKRLAISAGRTLSVVYASHLNDQEKAINCLRDVASRFGESAILEAQRGNIHFQSKKYEEALSVWQTSLWRPGADTETVDKDKNMLRCAGIGAGLRRDFSGASQWFEWAAEAAKDSGMNEDAFVGGALLDAAYCAFKDEAWTRAISLSYAGISVLQGDFDPEEHFEIFAAQRMALLVLLWMTGEVYPGYDAAETVNEPAPGQCSAPRPDKRIGDGPLVSWDMHAASLFGVALAFAPDSDIVGVLDRHLEKTRVASAKFLHCLFWCNDAFERGRLHEICDRVLGLQRSQWLHLAQEKRGLDSRQPYDGSDEEIDRNSSIDMELFLIFGLFAGLLKKIPCDVLATRWREKLAESADGCALRDSLEVAVSRIQIDLQVAESTFMDHRLPSLTRLGAACRLLASPKRSPKLTALAQHWSLLCLRKGASNLFAFGGILVSLAPHFADMWREHLMVPALLKLPQISASSLRDAINDDLNPPRQIARLLAAAETATGVTFQNELRAALEKAIDAYAMRTT